MKASAFVPLLSLRPGDSYIVRGYHTGDFAGELVRFSNPKRKFAHFAYFRVIDTMRPAPKVRNRCPYPECVRAQEHDGDHEFNSIREGALVEIPLELAAFQPFEKRESRCGPLVTTVYFQPQGTI